MNLIMTKEWMGVRGDDEFPEPVTLKETVGPSWFLVNGSVAKVVMYARTHHLTVIHYKKAVGIYLPILSSTGKSRGKAWYLFTHTDVDAFMYCHMPYLRRKGRRKASGPSTPKRIPGPLTAVMLPRRVA